MLAYYTTEQDTTFFSLKAIAVKFKTSIHIGIVLRCSKYGVSSFMNKRYVNIPTYRDTAFLPPHIDISQIKCAISSTKSSLRTARPNVLDILERVLDISLSNWHKDAECPYS